ncbi:hypothetical protein Hanom_Chr17g01584021 [Helianthus anomalus]
MVPIKCNQLFNQYPPLDLAEIKSQPLKIQKNNCCSSSSGGSFLWFPSPGGYLHLFLPMISTATQPPS